MKFKNKFFLILSSLFLLNMSFVFAKIPEPISKALKWIFVDLKTVGVEGDTTFVIYAKLMIWIILFALIYGGARKSIFKGDEDKNKAVAISIIVAVMGSLFIPGEFLKTVFVTYSTIFAIVLIVAPLAIIIWMVQNYLDEETKFNYGMKALAYGLSYYILGTLMASLATSSIGIGEFITEMVEWGILVQTIFLILAIWNLIKIFGGGVKTAAEVAAEEIEPAAREGVEKAKKLAAAGKKKGKQLWSAARRMYRLDKQILSKFKALRNEIRKKDPVVKSIMGKLKDIGDLEKTEEKFDKYLNTLIEALTAIGKKDEHGEELKIHAAIVIKGLNTLHRSKEQIEFLVDQNGFENALKETEKAIEEAEKVRDSIIAIEVLDKKIAREFK